MRNFLFRPNSLFGSILLCGLLTNVGFAQEQSFVRLQEMCGDTKDLLHYGYCIGFAEAIAGHVARENKSCSLLRSYIDKGPINFAFADVVRDLDPHEYPKDAYQALEEFFSNKGCS
jgi:hypothetical protein